MPAKRLMHIDPLWIISGLLTVIGVLISVIWVRHERANDRTDKVLFKKIDSLHDVFEKGMNERRAAEGEIRREVGDLRDRVGKIETTCVILHGKSVGSEHPEKE